MIDIQFNHTDDIGLARQLLHVENISKGDVASGLAAHLLNKYKHFYNASDMWTVSLARKVFQKIIDQR